MLASYARFLWDAEEEEEGEEGEELCKLAPPHFFHGTGSPSPPLTAAS